MVVIFDDEVDIRNVFCEMLELHEIMARGTGEEKELHQMLSSGEVEHLIMDLNLPGVDVFSLAKEIKCKMPDLQLLCISGDLDAIELKNPEVKKIFDGMLEKPFSGDDLLKAIGK